MAASRSCYRYLPGGGDHRVSPETLFELDESDVWASATSASPELRNSVPAARRKPSPAKKGSPAVPVNVPEWTNRRRWDGGDLAGDDDMDGGGGRSWVPPHEFLARTRIASFSVQEGAGRTLKGRDLRRVRNAIWEKTGFQD